MANKGKIDEWIEIPAIKREYDTFVGLIEDLRDRIDSFKKAEITLANAKSITDTTSAIKALSAEQEKLIGVETQLHAQQEKLVQDAKDVIAASAQSDQILKRLGGTLDQNIKLQISNKNAIGQVKIAMAELNTLYSEGRVSAANYAAKQAELTEEQERLKIANSELTQSIKATIKEDQAASGSIDERTQRLGRLRDLYRQLSDEERNNAQVGGALLQVIQEEDAQVKALNASLGNFQGNVGNYPKLTLNFSTALEILQGELAQVTATIEKYKAAGNADAATLEQLIKQQEILNILVNNAASGYASATQELKSNEKALQALAAAGFENTDAYKQLVSTTAELKDNVGDLRSELKAKASDTSFFDGLLAGAQGIVGAYSAAQGAIALFGVENEDLQKTLVKLQAAMSIVQGLQAVQNALQKESAARILITTGLEKTRLLITNLQTAAESRSIIVRYAAIAAQKALNAVMTVHPILAIIGAIGLLLISIKAFASGTEDAAKAQKKLNDSLEISVSLANDAVDAIGKANQAIIAQLEAQGASAKRIREENIRGIQQQIAEQEKLEANNRDKYDKAVERIKFLRKTGKDASKDEVDEQVNTRKVIDDIQRKKYDLIHKLELEQQHDIGETRKEDEAAQRNSLEVQKTKAATAIDANNRIADSEKYTAAAREDAVRRSENLQIQQIKLSKAQQLTDITLSADARAVIEQKTQEDIVKVQRDANEKIKQIQEQRVEIQRRTGFEQVKRDLELQIAGFEEVANSEKATTEQRLTALSEAQTKREQIIEGTKNYELKTDLILAEERKKGRKLNDGEILSITKQTAEERKGIEDTSEKEIINGLAAYYKARFGIIKDGRDRELALIATNLGSAQSVLNAQRDNELAALDQRYFQGLIKQKSYDSQRKAIEDRFNQAALLNELNFTEQQVALLKARGEDTTDAEEKIAAAKAALYKLDADNYRQSQEKKEEAEREFRDKSIEAAKAVYSAVFSIIGSAYDRQKNQIQEQIDLIDQKKEADLAANAASSASEEEKAAKAQRINIQADAQKQALERRQRQADQQKARFDKAKSITDIITNTAVAVMTTYKEYGGTPLGIALAALVGAIGAAELATVIAQPIPKYAEGREDGPAEWAITGDGGRHEVVELASGKAYVTPDTDTLTYLPAHSKVHKSLEDYLGTGWNVHRRLPAEDSSVMGSAALFAQLSKHQEKQTAKLLRGMEANRSTMIVSNTSTGLKTTAIKAKQRIDFLDREIFW